ncbi:MAG: PEGA domain-containing protein, partial [Proteobacteria bacterium]|nr:PEGA domain-containing protein [Pseudomonadota bacterium]
MRLALALTLLATSIPIVARAQPRDPRQRDAGYIGKDVLVLEIDDCPAVPPLPPDELLRLGAEHYQRGETLYLQGDYAPAVKEFIAAYCLKPDFYSILKDIGQALERDLDYERAIAYYERYVYAIPADAKRATACAPDPQVDKENVSARIGVLAALRAQVFVQTDPGDAQITISNPDSGVAAHGVSGAPIDVFGGHYTMLIEKPGYEAVTRPLETRIGKPLTVFVPLDPVKGRLAIQATPGDTRLFLDNNFVGIGRYQARQLKAGTYNLALEAPGHEGQTRRIVVLPDQETRLQVELFPRPQIGRRQAIIFAALAGATATGSIANGFGALDSTGVAGASLGGAALGFFGAYFFLPEDIALGTSSLAITATIAGYLAGTTSAALFTTDDRVITPLGGATALAAAAA